MENTDIRKKTEADLVKALAVSSVLVRQVAVRAM